MSALPTLSNVPQRQDIEIYRGGTLMIPFAVKVGSVTGPARPITGYTIAAHLRRFRLGASYTAFSVTIEDAAQGLFYISLSAAQTYALKCGELPTESASKYWWDVRILDTSNLTAFMRHGEATVFAQATVIAP